MLKMSQNFYYDLTLQPLREEIAKYYCIASSVQNLNFHNLFHLVHNEAQDEANT